MTVEELIIKLQHLSPDTRVVIRGYEDGYNDILKIKPLIIVPHPHQDAYYYGEYTHARTEEERASGVKAVELYGDNTKAG